MDLLALHKKAKEAGINIDIWISGVDWDQRMTVTGHTITDNFYDSKHYARTMSIQELEVFNGRGIDILERVVDEMIEKLRPEPEPILDWKIAEEYLYYLNAMARTPGDVKDLDELYARYYAGERSYNLYHRIMNYQLS